MHDHGEVRRTLDGGDTDAPHFFRQFRQGLSDAVLHLHLRGIDVGAELESYSQGADAIGGTLRAHVEHVFCAIDRLFQRRGHGFGNSLRVRAGIGRGDDHCRRHNFRIFRNWQLKHRDATEHQDDDRENAGENRSFDEKSCNVHNAYCFSAVAGSGTTGMPGMKILARPLTTTTSPSLSPERMMRLPCTEGPRTTGRYWASDFSSIT